MTARILYSQKSGDSLFAVANELRKSSKREACFRKVSSS
jgi:hypothetical protein